MSLTPPPGLLQESLPPLLELGLRRKKQARGFSVALSVSPPPCRYQDHL